MPSLLVEQRRPHHDLDTTLHYLHRPNGLYIIDEHEYVHSLIPVVYEKARRKGRRPQFTKTVTAHPLRPLAFQQSPRSLSMATMTFATEAAMAMGGAAPDSPPDLTNSKSSRSSSFHSSCLSDMMGPTDLSHFEDINLDDLQGRTSISSTSGSRGNPHAMHTFRDLTSGTKPRYPSLKGQVNNAVRGQSAQSALNAPRSIRRGFTSPSAPSLINSPIMPFSNKRSRSPSPQHPQVFSAAPRPLSRRSSRNLEVSPAPLSASTRRQSWQSGVRKTAKEKEAECDEDDDEVPEDAFILNVPLSPRFVQERSASYTPQASPSLSPSHMVPTSNHTTPTTAATAQIPNQSLPSPSPSIHNENTRPLSRPRTHSWQATFDTLDPDAQALTAALEQYQSEFEIAQEERVQKGASPVQEKESPKASAVELPPLRKGDPLVDPLRASKEKEKFLSRTRPSWLPPKDPKEEKKHLKEYQRIMQKIAESQTREEQHRKDQAAARERQEIYKITRFSEVILPDFQNQVRGPGYLSNRALWWDGIPAKLRGAVWAAGIGNELGVSATTFRVALSKAKSSEESESVRRHEEIKENTKAVFPTLNLFAPGQPHHEDLVDVCLAYTQYRHDVQNLGGIHHIAALLLLNMPAPTAFTALANLLNRNIPMVFLLCDYSQMHTIYSLTFDNLSIKLPALHGRFVDLRLEPSAFLDRMFRNLFCDCLSVEHASRVMDVYCIEGDKTLIRTALAVCMCLESRLYGDNIDDILTVIGDKSLEPGEVWDVGEPGHFVMGTLHEAGKVGSKKE